MYGLRRWDILPSNTLNPFDPSSNLMCRESLLSSGFSNCFDIQNALPCIFYLHSYTEFSFRYLPLFKIYLMISYLSTLTIEVSLFLLLIIVRMDYKTSDSLEITGKTTFFTCEELRHISDENFVLTIFIFFDSLLFLPFLSLDASILLVMLVEKDDPCKLLYYLYSNLRVHEWSLPCLLWSDQETLKDKQKVSTWYYTNLFLLTYK